MAEYIEREKFQNILQAKAEMATGTPKEVFYNAARMLDLLPAADVVEVVRCKDCTYCRESERTNKIFCTYHGDDYEFETLPNHYCSEGVGMVKGA